MPAQPITTTSAPWRSRSSLPTATMRPKVFCSFDSSTTGRSTGSSPAMRSLTPMAPT
jgi:hypothetical protein